MTSKEKIIYRYRFGVPDSSKDGKPELIEQSGVWPVCLNEKWKTGDGFQGKSTAGPGAWDSEEIECGCRKHILRGRKTFTQPLWYGRGTDYVPNILVEVIENLKRRCQDDSNN